MVPVKSCARGFSRIGVSVIHEEPAFLRAGDAASKRGRQNRNSVWKRFRRLSRAAFSKLFFEALASPSETAHPLRTA